MESFLQPMKTSLWGTLLASVLLVGCVIYLLDLYSPFDQFTIQTEKKTLNLSGTLFHENLHERVNFGEAMWFVWGVLLNSGVCESKLLIELTMLMFNKKVFFTLIYFIKI